MGVAHEHSEQETDRLARRKKSKQQARPTSRTSVRDLDLPAEAGTAGEPVLAAGSPSRRISPRNLLIAALAVAAIWWIALAALAIFTANPVTLNREQIFRSDYVVTGTLTDAGSGTLDVSKEWKQNGLTGTISVDLLKEAGADRGQTYIIPLENNRDGSFQVTRSRMPDEAPLIYPATSDADGQLSRLLSELSTSSAGR
jgi:hypothetical protein